MLGEFSGRLDEGMRKISFHIAKELSKDHQVLALDLRTVFSRRFWRSIREFGPQIIHYVHGGSLRSFALLKLISLCCPDAKTVMSVMRANPLAKYVALVLKPYIILVQTGDAEGIFRRYCKTIFLPLGGVDTECFKPVDLKVKTRLREKYGIDRDKFVVLHVGSIKDTRNVQFLRKLQGGDNQVIVVGSTSTGMERRVYDLLRKSGVVVWTRYFEHIEDIYALSDCYVFPVIPRKNILRGNAVACIDIPLSVLEAMSCNLPVITTRFSALPRMFNEGDGLFFAEKDEEFFNALREIKRGEVRVKTREKVEPYSWKNMRKRLEKLYYRLLR